MQPLVFLKEVRTELSKVDWPKREEVFKMTVLVIIVSTVVGLYLGEIDWILTKVMEEILK